MNEVNGSFAQMGLLKTVPAPGSPKRFNAKARRTRSFAEFFSNGWKNPPRRSGTTPVEGIIQSILEQHLAGAVFDRTIVPV